MQFRALSISAALLAFAAAPSPAGLFVEAAFDLPLDRGGAAPAGTVAPIPHFIAALDYALTLAGGDEVYLFYNTTSGGVGYAWRGLVPGVTTLAYLIGEYKFGEMLAEYYRDGLVRPGLGFQAHYVEAGLRFSGRPVDALVVELDLPLRVWNFQPGDGVNTATDPAFILPPDCTVFRPSATLKWQAFGPGTAAGLDTGRQLTLRAEAEFRSTRPDWGGSAVGVLSDARNRTTGAFPWKVSARWWSAFPDPLFRAVHLEWGAVAGIGGGLDDISRFKLGSETRFGETLSGTFLSEYFVDRFLLLRLAPALPSGNWAFLARLDAAWIADPRRAGRQDETGWVLGAGVGLRRALGGGGFAQLNLGCNLDAPRPVPAGRLKLGLDVRLAL